MRVLLMEDNFDTAECIRLCLEIKKPDTELKSASSFEETSRLLAEQQFDLIILDLGSPSLNARFILERIHSLTSSPLLILSSLYSPDMLATSLGLALNSCIQNPFTPREFMGRLSSLTCNVPLRPEAN